jgi:small-conductance mechanosensitive channel
MEIGHWVHADQSTGRVIHIPNAQIFTTPLANSTKGFQYIWNELPVLVTFESDWRKAKEILTAIVEAHSSNLSEAAAEQVRKASRKYMIFYSRLTPIVYTSVEDSGVLLTLRYLCDPRRRRGSAEALWEAILDAFADCDDIDFAYPTQRFYNNVGEGKEGARAPSLPGSPPRLPESPPG